MIKRLPFSKLAWKVVILVAYMLAVRVCVQFFPGSFRSIQQMQALDWPFVALWATLGFIGIFFLQRTNFPSITKEVKGSTWLIPAGLGLLFGLLSVINDLATHWTDFVSVKMNIPSIHIAFPQSLLIYPAGAMVHEIFNRILLLSLVAWFLAQLPPAFKPSDKSGFVIAALLTSLIEPSGDIGLWSFSPLAAVSCFFLDYLINISQAWCLYRYGILASVSSRITLYLVWHVGYGYYLGV